jgi:hypothetical protein
VVERARVAARGERWRRGLRGSGVSVMATRVRRVLVASGGVTQIGKVRFRPNTYWRNAKRTRQRSLGG